MLIIDGNYKYHAEMHVLTDSNKDGFAGMETSKLVQNSFGSIADLDQELNKVNFDLRSNIIE